MPIYGLSKAKGRGVPKIFTGVFSITGTGSVTTGLGTLVGYNANVVNSGTSLPTRTASITSVSGGTVNVVVTEHAASANSVATTAANVCVTAIGED